MRNNLKFSREEIKALLIAWIAISIAFSIVLSRRPFEFEQFILNFVLSTITVGIGFLLHELAHKVIAQRYGCWAEFRAFNQMLLLAIAFSFFGFIFAAPGAVFIRGLVDHRKNGIISIAGPVTNIILAMLFIPLKYFHGFIGSIGNYGFMINSWLALFNMIPVWNFDGAKIVKWNLLAYFAVVIISGIFVFVF